MDQIFDVLLFQYAVVEITTGNESFACAIPSKWLHDTKLIERDDVMTETARSYFPKDESKLSDMVDKRTTPDPKSDRWITYDVVILKLTSKFVFAF